MNKNLIAYRKALGINQSNMAKVAGCCLTSYCQKEQGKLDFTQSEMNAIITELKQHVPKITVDDVFFTNEVVKMKTSTA